MPNILGIDIGFANVGIVGLNVGSDFKKHRIFYTDLIRTQKSNKKLNLRKANDDQRRHAEIYRAYETALDKIRPDIVSAEAMSFVRNSGVMANIGGAWYGLYYLLLYKGIPTVDYSPQELKVVATGKKTATKEAMIDAVNGLWPDQIEWDQWPKSKWEHIADAAIAAKAAMADQSIPWRVLENDKRK